MIQVFAKIGDVCVYSHLEKEHKLSPSNSFDVKQNRFPALLEIYSDANGKPQIRVANFSK